MLELVSFLFAGLIGGAVNAAAGGAKLFVFPLLLAFGLPPIVANATGTFALWPGHAPAIWVYRRQLTADRSTWLRTVLPCLAGGLTGALALIVSGEKAFLSLVPLFILVAVITIAFGNQLPRLLERLLGKARLSRLSVLLLFVSGFYGGFFGAGIGFLILAVLALDSSLGLQRSNAFKNLLVFLINSAAVLPLTLSGLVDWTAAPAVLIGAMLGGAGGARLTQRIPERPLRLFIAVLGLLLSAVFLWRYVG